MCQISAVLYEEGHQEKIMDNVTQLEVTPGGLLLSSLFEEPKSLPNTMIKKIDFLAGTLTVINVNNFGENNDGG